MFKGGNKETLRQAQGDLIIRRPFDRLRVTDYSRAVIMVKVGAEMVGNSQSNTDKDRARLYDLC